MKSIIRRLKRLEATRIPIADGPLDWLARFEEVKRRAFAPLSPPELAWLHELSAICDENARDASLEAHRQTWDRFVGAFNRAVKEVPAPFAMCTADLFGQW
jgi:hypothetical protein